MSANPVFLFFSSPPSVGPFLLRLFLAFAGLAEVLHQWDASILVGFSPILLPWSGASLSASWFAVILFEGFLFLCLLIGLFVRLISGMLLLLIGAGIAKCYYLGDWATWNMAMAPMMICLTLIFIGGGRFSLDRWIGNQLLPQVG